MKSFGREKLRNADRDRWQEFLNVSLYQHVYGTSTSSPSSSPSPFRDASRLGGPYIESLLSSFIYKAEELAVYVASETVLHSRYS